MKYITVSPTLEKVVREKMAATMTVARAHYSKNIPEPTLRFRQLGRVAGKCSFNFYSNTGEIIINPDFFKNYYDDMLNDTVPHEIAHHLSAYIHGRKGYNHSWLWKGVMRVLGVPAADRCHEYGLEGVKVKNVNRPYKYVCGCGNHDLTPYKHQQFQRSIARGYRGLRCLKCHKWLVYEGFTHNGIFIPYKKQETVAIPLVKEVEVFTISTPPVTVKEPETLFRMVTKFVNGSLVNVKVPLAA